MFEIGNNLREARLRSRVDLVEAEQDTKIRSKYLAAMETEDFDVLPGPVYTRGFLRTYARYLGLDPQMYVDEYNARFGRFEDTEDSPVLGRPQVEGRRRGLTLRTMLVFSLAALAFLAWLGLRSDAGSPVRSGSPTPDKATAGADATGSFADRHDVRAVTTHAQVADSVTVRPAAPATPTRARLTIRATRGPSWIEVRRGNRRGAVLFSGTLGSGATRHFTAARLFVIAGLPSVLDLRIPGQRLTPRSAQTQTFVVTPTRIAAN